MGTTPVDELSGGSTSVVDLHQAAELDVTAAADRVGTTARHAIAGCDGAVRGATLPTPVETQPESLPGTQRTFRIGDVRTESMERPAVVTADPDALHSEYLRTRDPLVRERLLDRYTGLARALAERFVHRGNPRDDLTQVAFVGLLKAIDGFDPTRGLRFSTYATPTIVGELKRHLRDQSWSIRPPRRVHDLYLVVERTLDDLAQEFGRPPSIPELADRIGVTAEDVIEAMEATSSRRLPSIESLVGDGGRDPDPVACDDPSLADVDRRMTLATLVGHLPERDRQMLRMRFERDMTQLEIAHELGRSQMQVSRALARCLDRLRALAGTDLAFAD